MTPARRAHLAQTANAALAALAAGQTPDRAGLDALDAIVLHWATGGEVTRDREALEAAFAPLRSEDDERYGNVVNGTLDEAIEAVLALTAERPA